MNEIDKAYIVLGLEPGASYQEVKEAYQLLISGLHPDKHKGKKKEQAEKKAKQINNAKDLLDSHFNSEHEDGPDCSCQPGQAKPESYSSELAETSSSSTSSKEERARKAREREAEREKEDSSQSEFFYTSQEDDTKDDIFADDLFYAYNFDVAKKRASLYWKISLGALVFYLGCFCYGNIVKGMYSTGGLKAKPFTAEESQVNDNWKKYQREKLQLVEKLTGKRPTEKSIERWRPPFEPTYKRLLASVENSRKNRSFYDTSPHYSKSQEPNPGTYTGDKRPVIKELNRNITFYQGRMDKWKREVDHYDASMSHGATSVDVQAKRDKAYSNYVSFKNKRDNAKRQLNNLTKRQPTLNDLSNPYYYSKRKNPFGAGTKPPSPKSKYLQLDDIND